MKITILLSIALILAGFFPAPAQNNVTIPEQLQRQNASFEYSEFKNPKLSTLKKTKSQTDWWEPDTVYVTGVMDGGGYIPLYMYIFNYNSQGLLNERIDQRWKNDAWINNYIITYTYDSNNNLITRLDENNSISINTYDSNNNMLTNLQQHWENNSWVNDYLYTFTYDSSNNRLTKLRQDWINNSWINNHLTTYTYDSDNNMLTQLEQNEVNNSYGNSLLYTYTYDSNNNLLTQQRQNWFNNSWLDPFLLTTYTYDSNNNLLTELWQRWNNNSWVNEEQYIYTYDPNNNLLTELWQRWSNNSWVNGYQYLMAYDENGNGISAEFWMWMNESWQPISDLLSGLKLYYNNMQSTFQGGFYKMTASYKKVSDLTSIAKLPAIPELNAISIYPNPTKGELRISNRELGIKDIQVFDIMGRSYSPPLEGQGEVNISHLPAGTYFVQVTTEKGVVTKTVVKL